MEKTKKDQKTRLFYALSAVIIFVGGVTVGVLSNASFSTSSSNSRSLLSSIFGGLNNQGGPVSNTADNLDYDSVEEAYDTLVANYDGELDKTKLIDGLKKGLAEATGDPYTEFFPAEETKEFAEQISGSFTGIGAELGKQDNAVVIISPIKGYPAEKAGVQAKDVILKINDEDALSLTISEAVKKIRGEAGTTVKLNLLRGSEQVEVTITRADIKIPSVEYEVLDGAVCNIRISRFSDDTDQLVREAAKVCKEKSATSVLLDLRNDPGGYLDQAIRVSSHWIDQGKTVVTEKRAGKVIKTHTAGIGQEFKGMKTVVLINEGSASASEIVAGALKDYGLATLVGQKTYGKGSVQEIDQLGGGTSLKITIARWFTPNDKNIDQEGIEPDHKVEITLDQVKAGEDPQKSKAIELLKTQ